MKCINATNLNGKSGGAQPRDLLFSHQQLMLAASPHYFVIPRRRLAFGKLSKE
jgi:hypothetical protein